MTTIPGPAHPAATRARGNAAVVDYLTGGRVRAAVDEAAMPIMRARHDVARRWERGECLDPARAEVVVTPLADLGPTVLARCAEARRLVGITSWSSTADGFRANDDQNRRLLDETGARMTSYFDVRSLRPDVLRAVGEAGRDMPYHLSYAPLQMKIFDAQEVLLPGPVLDGDRAALIFLRGSDHLDAAARYARTVADVAVPASGLVEGPALLTEQRHSVADLLATGHRDEVIAARLALPLQTVRTEVEILMATLGCSNRLATGVVYRAWHTAPWSADTLQARAG